MLESVNWLVFDALVAHWAIVIGLSARVIMRRRPVGVSLAWIAIIVSVPFVGAVIYLVLGENRVSAQYTRRAHEVSTRYRRWRCAWGGRDPAPGSLQHLARAVAGFPITPAARLDLLEDFESIFRSMIAAIEASTESCCLEFYIWHPGGLVDEVDAALRRAAGRGVACRVLVDAVGSKPFLGSEAMRGLRRSGVAVAAALPTGPISMFVSRADLRNHRKVAVIDGATAYTGSQNMVDPRFFKQDAGVGQWVDAMIRIEGPAATALGIAFAADWEVVSGEVIDDAIRPVVEHEGGVGLQAVPSGPARDPLAILKLLLAVVYSARHELVVTTPYFVPDDSLLTALVTAAQRGVEVTLVLPARNDSWLVGHASRSFFDELLEAGVRIAAFHGGLLHTKSVTVDGITCVFGSLNLDMRSLWLNFEMSVLVCDQGFTARVRELQQGYLDRSSVLVPDAWSQRPLRQRLVENTVRLMSPLL